MKNRGFTLIELIIAISVLSFGIILVYSAFVATATLAYNNSSRFTGAYLAQEGLEIIRNLRDKNFISGGVWSAGLLSGPCGAGCQADYKVSSLGQLAAYDGALLGINSDGFYSYDFGATPTIFKRKITVSAVAGTADALQINALVSWNYNGKPYTFDVSEYLYDWK